MLKVSFRRLHHAGDKRLYQGVALMKGRLELNSTRIAIGRKTGGKIDFTSEFGSGRRSHPPANAI